MAEKKWKLYSAIMFKIKKKEEKREIMDVKRALDHFNISYSEHHPEVSKDCIGVDCPFCSDNNKHCGIFLDNGIFTCWKCKSKGSLYKLINKIKGITYDEYANFIGIKYQEKTPKSELDRIFGVNKMKPKEEKFSIRELKKEIEKFMTPAYEVDTSVSYFRLIEAFLNKRGFTKELLRKHRVFYAHSGKYQGRLVIPIPPPYREEMAGIIARDITGTAMSKYVFPSGFKAHNYIYPVFRYNYYITKFIIVEGVFDAWALSPYSYPIAIFGKELSDSQLFKMINTIVRPRQSEMIIMLDGDATLRDSEKIANKLDSFFNKTRIVNLPENEDPASMDRNELRRLLKSWS
ncbi:MAG: hypothetical protein ACTSQY_09495 [Candidatus Odinarchaeia archaeon]